ncbi:MAG: nicotinate phosphoribosyltransferase [Verrucomicrobia bacterium]|nr:nicotinate phosphoribosyltransferase [Verrucomicrobiota bacterium]
MNLGSSALLTDLYQLTMLQAYFEARMEETAVFEFFVRRLPPNRNFLIAAGLEQVLGYLEGFQFTPQELQWLESTGKFGREFVRYLGSLRFPGDVHAMPEGTLFFANEPILRVTAPIPQAQIVETRIINLLHFQTLIASKAARCALVAPGKTLVDFGLRRAHGAEAGLLAARACYLAGFTATSDMLAGQLFDIPLSGTMAHSFVQACDSEEEAFMRFARANRDNVALLLDTYDTEAAATKVVQLAARLRSQGISIKGVRLDSGDLAEHARRVRRILDDGGLCDVQISASGNLDEYRLQKLVSAGSPIDGFGVGTRVLTSADAPYLDCAYKIQEYAGCPRRKLSEGKDTWPGRKQVFRCYDAEGRMTSDVVTLESEAISGEPLLQGVMQSGKRVADAAALLDIRQRVARQLKQLPQAMLSLEQAARYPVLISESVRNLAASLDATSARSGLWSSKAEAYLA